jgi:hypothetical protein
MILYDKRRRQLRNKIFLSKNLVCIWWDMKIVVYYELLESDYQFRALALNQQQLIHLNDELEGKRLLTAHGTRQVILQNNTARLHVVKWTKDVIYSLGWE